MHGNLRTTRLPEIIRQLNAARSTGTLALTCHDHTRRLVFDSGRIVRVESDSELERFGSNLVNTGRIRQRDLNEAIEIASRQRVSVAAALLELDRLPLNEIRQAETTCMVKIVEALLTSSAGEFRFEPAESPVAGAAGYSTPPERVILEGIRRANDVDLLRSLVGDPRAQLRLEKAQELDRLEKRLTERERGLASALRSRGMLSVEQVVTGASLTEIQTLSTLYALIFIGLVERETTASPQTSVQTPPAVEAPVKPEPTAPAQQARTERRVLGRFEIQRLVKRGSMGEVFRATDPDNGRTVAIKILRPTANLSVAALGDFMTRLKEGVQTARELFHPAIASVWEAGLTKQNYAFLVSEYVSGTTLRDLLPSGAFAPNHALELVDQVYDALAHAHQRGIVHGLMRPSNVLVAADGRAKVKDFGLPRLPGAESSADHPYLSPEQWAGRPIEATSDVFSLGVLSYRMFTGTLPYPDGAFATEHSVPPPKPLRQVNAELPQLLEEVISRCLAVDPAERFSDAQQLRNALETLSRPESAVPVLSAPPARVATPQREARVHAPVAPAAQPALPPPPLEASLPPPAPNPAPPRETRPVSAPQSASPPVPRSQPAQESLEESFRQIQQSRAFQPVAQADSNAAVEPPPVARAGRSRGTKAVLVVTAAVVAIAVSAGVFRVLFNEPPSIAPPVSERADVLATPAPFAGPSGEDLAALLAGPSDEVLFRDAQSALARGDLRGSRRAVTALLDRTADFPGARALLARIDRIEAERREAEAARRAAANLPEPVPVKAPTSAELLEEARRALESGALQESKSKLTALLESDPLFAEAAELMEVVDRRIWTMTLPKRFSARHNHRFGACEGTLVLTREGLTFHSEDHEWLWTYAQLVSMDRPDATSFDIVTRERELLRLLANKRFRFELHQTFSQEDWDYFLRTVEGEAPAVEPR